MFYKFKILTILLLGLWVSYGCQEDVAENQVILPENLAVSLNKNPNGSVTVSFSATNANFYKVGFGVPNQTLERAIGNEAVYAYRNPGEYKIIVQAHVTEELFISKETAVTITEEELGLGIPMDGYESPLTYAGYNLVWQDEFSGTSLSEDWVFEIGDGCPNLCGWGNNELEYYRRENTEVKDGYLTITAKQESVGGKNYTSSRIKTQGKKSFQFGRVDIRAVLPKGQGVWPALWMLGDAISTISWPACGEIDIMEMIGGNPNGRDNTVHGTVHWDNNGAYAYYGGSTSLQEGIFNDKFHVFSIVWDEKKIAWLLDGVQYHEIDISPASLDEFRKSFFFIFNVAVGGNWPGSPDGSTVFPQQMVVDYIRVFQK